MDMGEYDVGCRLKVTYTPIAAGDTAHEGINLELEILRAYKPFSISTVCHVRIHCPSSLSTPHNLPDTCLVKLYDRRYDRNTREDRDEKRPYSAAKEAAHQQYLLSPRRKPRSLWQIGAAKSWRKQGETEAAMEVAHRNMFDNEVAAYADMRELQGTFIPTLYGRIQYTSPVPPPATSRGLTDYRYTVRGILLEHIPSITLIEYLTAAMKLEPPPYDLISQVCDAAMVLAHRLDDFRILNDDARLENVLVVPGTQGTAGLNSPTSPSSVAAPAPTSRCVGIDFACSRIRYHDETDEQWRCAKQFQDELGAIGVVMEGRLKGMAKKRATPVDPEKLWRYKDTRRWWRELNEEEYALYLESPGWNLYKVKRGEGETEDEDSEGEESEEEGEDAAFVGLTPKIDEYEPGYRMKVKFTSSHTTTPDVAGVAAEELHLDLEVIHAYKPFTMSVVCHVRITTPSTLPLPDNLPSTCIVKLYDRRYCTAHREAYDEGRPYSAARELAYQELQRDELRAKAVLLGAMRELSKEGDEAGLEVHIERACSEMAEAEARAYEDMPELQGTLIPALYGSIRYQSPHSPPGEIGEASNIPQYTARGVLIEYIPSITLGNFLRTAMEASPLPYDAITEVCDQAMKVMDRIDDFNVLNDDVRLDNVLVVQASPGPSVPDPSLFTRPSPPKTYRCVCIDFACTRLRYPDETDEQWRRAKECKDEQGAIGWVASKVLSVCAKERKIDVQGRLWQYPGLDKRSERWDRSLNDGEQAAYEKGTLVWGLHPEEVKRYRR